MVFVSPVRRIILVSVGLRVPTGRPWPARQRRQPRPIGYQVPRHSCAPEPSPLDDWYSVSRIVILRVATLDIVVVTETRWTE
jgi:hypothetical protein